MKECLDAIRSMNRLAGDLCGVRVETPSVWFENSGNTRPTCSGRIRTVSKRHLKAPQ